MINQINCSLSQVDYILHVADIHIRNWKRHKEYRLVIDQLLQAIDKLPPNSIVTIGGDIVHAKTDMSPELVQMVSYLLNSIADRVPTIVIAGNHDVNLNNNNRLDALTPIIEANKHSNLFYLRNTGVYKIGDAEISVMSLIDPPDLYQVAKADHLSSKKKIAMFHGTLINSVVDSGMVITRGLEWDTFAGFDIVLLGDIHKRQVLAGKSVGSYYCKEQNLPLIFYPGSLVQQGFGEHYEGHGFALVDLNHNKVEFVDLYNCYGFYTIDVVDGILPKQLPITDKTSIRLRTKQTSPAQLKRVLATLRKQYSCSEVIVSDLDRSNFNPRNSVDGEVYRGDVRDVKTQHQLLVDFANQQNAKSDLIDQMIQINDQLNQQIQHQEIARGVIWKPKKFEFSNMFSYGENNVVDFTNFTGTCGLFAPNHVGKSALLDALCFCLFDHTSRAGKAEQVLNNQKDTFWCKFQFELNGQEFFIEKVASRYKKGPLAGKLRVDINFWTIDESGEVLSLNGEQRRDTDRIIQSYIGSFNDFVLTTLSLQGNNSNFVEKTQSERKELLANFLDLSLFDQLFEMANRESRTATILLENYQKQDFEVQLGDAEAKREELSKQNNALHTKIENVQQQIDQTNSSINQLHHRLAPSQAEGFDIDQLHRTKKQLISIIADAQGNISSCNRDMTTAAENINALLSKKEDLKSKFDWDLFKEYNFKQSERDDLNKTLSLKKVEIEGKLAKLAKLEEHEYDPNCSYCVNNVFVKDAIATKQELEHDLEYTTKLKKQVELLTSFLELNVSVVERAQQLNSLELELTSANFEKNSISSRLANYESHLNLHQHRLEKVERDIESYNREIEVLKSNGEIKHLIDKASLELDQLVKQIKELREQYQRNFGAIQVLNNTVENCQKSMDHMQELSDKLEAYDLYCQATHKDGIPYTLISQAVPFIQNYVNNILTQVVDFTVEMETDGKNINAFIKYESGRWPLELASGMERFVSSLAIRIALIKVTNLPKPDFMAIDEGLGVLDSSNLNSMHMFFNYMKEVFRFSLIISHIDVVRDMVDTVLSIDRQNGFSRINV